MCKQEQEYAAARRHPKLVRFITQQIDKLAADMGFSEQQIKRREFRAEKDGDHIVKIFVE